MNVSKHANHENINEAYNYIRAEVFEAVKQIESRHETLEVSVDQKIDTALLRKLVETHLAKMEESVSLLNKLVELQRKGKLDQVALLALGTWS